MRTLAKGRVRTTTEWWESAYRGGPMVAVPGFPRPLYPPDAAAKGKKPSGDGPDVEAYKRTVSRAGRWPWQSFDRAFSNGFSHGTSGNVGESGIAGIQRQQKLEPTGWIGEATFNTLRSIRVPEGRPHAGEMAMDKTAANLIAEAWKMFAGAPPPKPDPAPPPTSKSARQARLEKAIAELGVTESPANSNNTKYGAWYGVNYQPWCAIFVTWADQHGKPCKSFRQGSAYAYVPYVVSDARAKRNGLTVTSSPEPGDLVCFDWEQDGTFDHIGLFEKWTGGGTFSSIEGNTSTSNQSNGGEVQRRSRSQSGVVFVRVAE